MWSCLESLSHRRIAFQSEAVCWIWEAWQADFHRSVERESLEWLEGAEWKQMSEMLTAECVYVCLHVCLNSHNGPIVNFNKPKSNCCSYFFYHFYSFLFLLCLFFATLTDSGRKSKWRCSGMRACLRNIRSPPSKSRTTLSSSQVSTWDLVYRWIHPPLLYCLLHNRFILLRPFCKSVL